MIYIVSSKKTAALGLKTAAVRAKILPEIPAGFAPGACDQVYFDVSGLSAAEIKKTVRRHKKRFPGCFWGVIDPKGAAEDPAFFFFEGAGDYIGPALVKKGLDKKRFAAVFARAGEKNSVSGGMKPGGGESPMANNMARNKTKKQKLPAGNFEGWKSLAPGTAAPFFFVFVSIAGKEDLHSMIGEANSRAVKSRFRETLLQCFRDADGLLWMETEDNFLFLVPPRQTNGRLAVEAALKVLMNSRLIGVEKLALPFPVEFSLAMHYGKTVFYAPGKTGSVISESVNYIFHLGARKAEAGRLTVSADVPAEAFPEGLLDIFKSAGEFEGVPVRHSRRFTGK